MKHLNYCVALLFICITYVLQAHKADLIIFSKDRPLQLYALLESVEHYIQGLASISVLFLATDQEYAKAYQQIIKRFKNVRFVAQVPKRNRSDFQENTLMLFGSTPSRYIIFAVDDIIVKDYIDIENDIILLEQTGSYGFYYRLGTHLNFCHPMNQHQPVPPFESLGNGCITWIFGQGTGDWGYPSTIDMTLYRKDDIRSVLTTMHYASPNLMEGHWSRHQRSLMRHKGICYELSKVVNIPLNQVQVDGHNRHMKGYPAINLLAIFNEGLKIDIQPLYRIANATAHMEYVPTFVART